MKTLLLLILSVLCGGCIVKTGPDNPYSLVESPEEREKTLRNQKYASEVREYSSEVQKRVMEGKPTDDLVPPVYPGTVEE